MTQLYQDGETVNIPIFETTLAPIIEDASFNLDLFYPLNATTIPDVTYTYSGNPANFRKLGQGKYIFTKPSLLGQPLGAWRFRIHFVSTGIDFNLNEVVDVR